MQLLSILKTIARAVHLLDNQGLAFCGHHESIYGYENKAENGIRRKCFRKTN